MGGANFLQKLLGGMEMTYRSPKFNLKIGDRNREVREALLRRINEERENPTNPEKTFDSTNVAFQRNVKGDLAPMLQVRPPRFDPMLGQGMRGFPGAF
jgi:hypothetical protein